LRAKPASDADEPVAQVFRQVEPNTYEVPRCQEKNYP
jgi:hypothetical protein